MGYAYDIHFVGVRGLNVKAAAADAEAASEFWTLLQVYQVARGDYARFWRDLLPVLVGGLDVWGDCGGLTRVGADCGCRGEGGVRTGGCGLGRCAQSDRQRSRGAAEANGGSFAALQDDGEKQATAKVKAKDNGNRKSTSKGQYSGALLCGPTPPVSRWDCAMNGVPADGRRPRRTARFSPGRSRGGACRRGGILWPSLRLRRSVWP